MFQDWLLEYEPAVGIVDYAGANEAQNVRERTRKNCGIYINNNSTTNPTLYFDPLFNAFHANAVHHIFPLLNQREKVSWWYTLRHVISNVEMKFHGQALTFFPISVENSLHHNYPCTLEDPQEAWRDYIENVRMQAPVNYANHALRLGHKSMEKNLVRNLKYGPKTRLTRGMHLVDFVFLFVYSTFFPSVNDNSYLFQCKAKLSSL